MKRIIITLALVLCLSLLFSGCEKVGEENESETQAESITNIPESEPETDAETSPKIILPPSDTVFFKPSGYKDISFAVMNGSTSLVLSCPAEWETKLETGVKYAILRDGVEIGAMTSRAPDTSGFIEVERTEHSVGAVSISRVLEKKGDEFRYRYSYSFEESEKERNFSLTVKYEEADNFTARRLSSPLTDRLTSDPGFSKLDADYKSILIIGNSFIRTSCIGDALRAMLSANGNRCDVTDVSIGMAQVSTFTSNSEIVTNIRNKKYDAVFLCGLYNMGEVAEVSKMKAYCDQSGTDLILFPAHNEERSVINKALGDVDGIKILDWKAELEALIASGVNIWSLCIDDYYRHSNPLAGYVGAHMIYRAMYGKVPEAMNKTANGIDTSVAMDVLGDYVSTAKISYAVQNGVCIFVT